MFTDLLIELRRRREQQEADAQTRPPRPDEDSVRPGRRPRRERDRDVPLDPEEQDRFRYEPGDPLSIEETTDRIVLHTLAGRQEGRFNNYMVRAEKALSEGRFYDAEGYYRAARALRLSNPLPMVGMALARLGANELLTAAFHHQRALNLFPPLMETRPDVVELLGEKVARKRAKSLDELIESRGKKAEASLLALAATVHSSLGNEETAAGYARRLKAAAGEEKVLKAYAAILLGEQKPGPATRPAKE
jgi:hypothetical protein